MDEPVKKRFNFIINTLYILLIIAIIYVIFKYCLNIIMPFLIAFILVAILNPLVKTIHRKIKVNKKVVSAIILAFLYIIIGFILIWVVILLIAFMKDIFISLPELYKTSISPAITNVSGWIETFIDKLPVSWGIDLDTIVKSITSNLGSLFSTLSTTGVNFVTSFISNIPSFLLAVIFCILVSFFLSIQYDEVIEFFKLQLPKKVNDNIKETIKILKNTLFKYFKAYLIIMLITFIELSIGLTIIGVKNSIIVAFGIAVFDLLPVFGTGAIMIPWIIIQFILGDFTLALGLLIVYCIVTIVRNIIEPKVLGDQLGLNPILSLICIYIGYKLFGIAGMIALPIIAAIIVYLHKKGIIKLYKTKEGDNKDGHKRDIPKSKRITE